MMPSTGSRNTKKTERVAPDDARSDRLWGSDRAPLPTAVRARLGRRPQLLPGMPPPPRRGVLVTTTLLLVGVLAAVLVHGGRPRPDSTGINLPAESPSLKLNNTSAEPLAVAQAPATQPELDKHNPEVAPTPPVPLPPVPPLSTASPGTSVSSTPSAPPVPPLETTPAPPAPVPTLPVPPPVVPVTPLAATVSENGNASRNQPARDTPMMRNWQALGLPALLAAALSVSPAHSGQLDGPQPAQADQKQQKDSTKEAETDKDAKPDIILKEVRALRDSVADLNKKVQEKLEDLDLRTKIRIEKVQGDVNGLRSATAPIGAMQSDLESLRRELAQLRQEVNSLRSGVSTSSSLYPSAPTAPTGRVQLVNTYPQQMTILLNNRAYRLLPGETRTVDAVPAGPFTYQVLGVQPEVQPRTLAANDTYTINVFPR
jgi:hypothetical protein